MGYMTLTSFKAMFQKEIYMCNTSKLQLKIVLMTKNSQSCNRKRNMPIPCYWAIWEEKNQKSKWINQSPFPRRTHEGGKSDDFKFSWEWIMKEDLTQVHICT